MSADCRSVSYRWATPHVGEHVADVLKAADDNDWRCCRADYEVSGPLFERWCDTKLSEGGTFRMRRLGTNKLVALKRFTGKALCEPFMHVMQQALLLRWCSRCWTPAATGLGQSLHVLPGECLRVG